jgi:hypothetical protein
MKESQVSMLLAAPFLAKVMSEGYALAFGIFYSVLMCIHLYLESRGKK